MRYCRKCVTPDTRPGTIFKDGICQACLNYDKRQDIDWDNRWQVLKSICNDHRGQGRYDCVIPVSGGKDSHVLTHIMVNEMGMTPLLITVGDPFTKTKAGTHNLHNLGETFGCDHITFQLSASLFRNATRIGFEKLGEPLKFIETCIYTVPIKIADGLGISLVVYGEDGWHEYGSQSHEMDGMNHIQYVYEHADLDFWRTQGIGEKGLNALVWDDLYISLCKVVFMSHYMPWSGEHNFNVAQRYGFKDLTHEWDRIGNIESYDQIDSVAYIVHLWMKYPKFGFARTTDIASRWIREGKITRQEAKRLVMNHDRLLDPRALDDFVVFLGYRYKEFWDIVDIFWNQDIFEDVGDRWVLRDPVYKDLLR
jgi:N-acetyl sugar amidotransferase